MRATRPGSGRAKPHHGMMVAAIAVLSALALLVQPAAAPLPAAAAAGEVAVVSSMWPNMGAAAGGETVSIYGHGFTGATGVRFGRSNAAPSFTVASDNEIRAVAPPAPVAPNPLTLVNVFVDSPAGPSVETPQSWYRYLAPPTITSMVPATSSFAGGQTVDLVVAGLPATTYPTAVSVDGAPAGQLRYDTHDDSEPLHVSFSTPPHVVGTAAVTVTAAGGTSAPVTLTYVATPQPAISTIAPPLGPIDGGTVVVITGEHLAGATSVVFGDVPAVSFTIDSDTQITAVAPAVASFRDVVITVATPAGRSAYTGLQFHYVGPPVVWSVSPAAGPPEGGTNVDIFGADLWRTTGVWFGDVAATTWSNRGDRVVAVAPPQAEGTVVVRLDSERGRSREAVGFTYTSSSPPSVDAVSPKHGPAAGGNTVVITGRGFSTATSVDFGQHIAEPAQFTIDSDTQITAIAPASTYDGLVNIYVTNGFGTSLNVSSAWYTYDPAPWVSNIEPRTGPSAGGTEVVIYGFGIETATAVRFGDVPAASFSVDGYGNLHAVAPAHAPGSVAVMVESPAGSSDPALYAWNTFIYVAPGVPVVSSLSPATGWTSGGAVVTITGTDMDRATGVRFGAIAATDWSVIDAHTLRAVAPPAPAGTTVVTVESGAGDSPSTYRAFFWFSEQPVPEISGLDPAFGPAAGGNTIKILGRSYTGTSSVTFAGVPAVSFTVVSDSEIHAVVPPSGTADDTVAQVRITNAVGANRPTDAAAYQYRTVHALSISSVTPNRGGIAGGEWPSIYGSGFLAATAVKMGGRPVNFSVNSDYQITIQTPPVAVPYLYNVSVETPTATTASSPASHYLYLGPAELRGLDHHLGVTSGGDQLTIQGDQLLGVTRVDVGLSAAPFTVVDNHTIVATVPPCAVGTVVVTLRSPYGDSTLTLGSLYTYRTPGTPIVTEVTTNRGPLAGGGTVVIRGSGFAGAAGVRFGNVTPATSFTIDTDTQITAVVPAGASATLVNVFVDNANGSNPNGPTSWYLYQPS